MTVQHLTPLPDTSTTLYVNVQAQKNIDACKIIESELKSVLNERLHESKEIDSALIALEAQITTSNRLDTPKLSQKIVRDGDQYYLIPINKNLTDLSIEERTRATQAYKQLKPETVDTMKRTQLHHAQTDAYNQRKTALTARRDVLTQDIVVLSNQIEDIHSLRDDEQLSLQPSPTSSTAPRAISRSLSPQQRIAQGYGCVLAQKHKLSPNGLNGLRTWAKTHSPALRDDLYKIKPGVSIPIDVMKVLLRRLMNFGVSVTNNKQTTSNQMSAKYNLHPK